MTTFSDQIRVGKAGGPYDPRNLPNGITFSGGGVEGVPMFPFVVYDNIPLTAFSNNLATAQTITSANFVLSTGTGITTTAINGTTYYDLGVARTLIFTGNQTTVAAALMTVTGLDDYLMPLTATLTGPTGTGTAETLKAFRYVAGARVSGNTTSAVVIGTSDRFGITHAISAFGYLQVNWANVWQTSSVGFSGAVQTSPSTSALGDVRGVYLVPSASDGSKRLVLWQFIKDPNSVTGAYGVAQV